MPWNNFPNPSAQPSNMPPWNTGGQTPWGDTGGVHTMPYTPMPWNIPPTGPGGNGGNDPLPPVGGGTGWNPFTYDEGNASNWHSPFGGMTYGQQFLNWRPDFGDGGAGGFYDRLINPDQEVAGQGWNEYAKMLANALLTRNLFAPQAQDVYYGTLSPEMNYGNTDSLAGPTSDTQAQQWNSSGYWDTLGASIGGYLNNAFGQIGDRTEGSNDQVEKTNKWLADVINMGKKYSNDDPSGYWSTARQRDRGNAWNFLSSQAQSLGINEEIFNLADRLYNANVGTGPQYNNMGTGGWDNYLGRNRNSAYS